VLSTDGGGGPSLIQAQFPQLDEWSARELWAKVPGERSLKLRVGRGKGCLPLRRHILFRVHFKPCISDIFWVGCQGGRRLVAEQPFNAHRCLGRRVGGSLAVWIHK